MFYFKLVCFKLFHINKYSHFSITLDFILLSLQTCVNSIVWKYIRYHSGVLSAIIKYPQENQTLSLPCVSIPAISRRIDELVCSSCTDMDISHRAWKFCSHSCTCLWNLAFLYNPGSTTGSVLFISGIVLTVTCFIGLAYLRIVLFSRHFQTTRFHLPHWHVMSPNPSFSCLYCYNVVISSELE